MNIMKKNILTVAILSLSIIVSSCVGTVKDKDAPSSNILSKATGGAAASFEGLQMVNPVSHDKVELFFLPADGDPGDLTYEIYINNSPIPIKIGGRSLSTNASGFYYFAVTGLSLNSTYNFNMRVVEAGAETESLKLDPSKSLNAKTFANETADFMGVSSLSLGAGEAGKNTINVKWVPAVTTGSSLNPRTKDPIAYEISYISQVGGVRNLNNPSYTGNDRVVIQTPTSISTPPQLSKEREFTITGLNPDTTYYIQVRAIHKAYVDYQNIDPLYKRELNTYFLKIKTLASGALFDFNSSLAYLTNPVGENGLTNLDVSWIPASGEFNHYRICYKQVAIPGGAEPIADYLNDSDLDAMLNNPASCIQKASSTTNLRISGLSTYAYYQVRVLACKTVSCESTARIKSDLLQKRIITNITPFTGILSIDNPNDETKLNEISLNFDAPVVSAGYLNRFKLFCYNSTMDSSPVEIQLDGSVSSATGKSSCDGIQSITSLPSSFSDFSSFNKITLRLPSVNGNARYCFSLLPSIYSTYLNQENIPSAIVKCFTPEIKTPNIQQFPGRSPVCSIAEKSISVAWPEPTGGLYSKYIILYREKLTPSDTFIFGDAVNDYILSKTNTAASSYRSIDNIDKSILGQTISNLVPGRTYSIGVLTYLENGPNKIFSQYNLNTGDCSLPLPTATFNEWVDILAVGPKEDGLTPPQTSVGIPAENLGTRSYILETLDNDSIPVEIATLSNQIDPDTLDALASSRLGNITFNGVYGAKDAKETSPLHQYSNSGIIRIGWKDVTFYNETETLNSYIINPSIEKTPTIKNSRKFGYRIYRSDDNKLTWLDLTKNGINNKFQTLTNEGLIHPSNYSWRKRNNSGTNTEQVAFFTDYSVKFAGIDGEIDRARTYWYKIIPVFDGKELSYGASGNTSHHIVRVTLPPRNMALVHRLIANRTTCLELDKSIDKSNGMHYSCEYNGLGSSGLTAPWSLGNTVYDQGGDLLVDRFELSCPFTRGDVNGTNSDSNFSGTKLQFKGFSQFSNVFKGCFNDSNYTYEPDQGSNPSGANYNYKQVIQGDCFGRDAAITASPTPTACVDPTRGETYNYIYPGAEGGDKKNNCMNPSYNGPNFMDQTNPLSHISSLNSDFPTQSEFAGVYYMRSAYNYGGDNGPTINKMVGSSGQTLRTASSPTALNSTRQNSCSVNLAYVNNTGEYRPRWIPVNFLLGRVKNASNTTLTLYNKTISQIRNDGDLYDGTHVKAPTPEMINTNRMTSNSTLARVVTSNSAKLPPLDGLSQTDLYNICSTYKVQVGVETKSRGFMALNSIQSKRIFRRKESTIAAAWPATYDNTKVTNIERGTYSEGSNNNSCNSNQKFSVATRGTASYTKTQNISPLFPQSNKIKPYLMVGSSSKDPSGSSNNTEKCVSKFGIQDLAGNIRETNADEIFCDFNQDVLYLGNISNDVKESKSISNGGSGYLYDPDNLTPWVLSSTQSGSCSLNEEGAARTASYISGGTFNSIYTYSGLNTNLVLKAKTFDQDAILSGRNGDGSFLDFGQANLGPSLSVNGALAMEDDGTSPAMLANYFNPVLGMPLTCGAGCDNNASDNAAITSDKLVQSKSYDTLSNPLGISMTDYPTNNGVISNNGISEITQGSIFNSNDPNMGPTNYYNSIDVGANYNDPLDNSFVMATVTPPNPIPGDLNYVYYRVARGASLKMYTGGSATTESGRFSMHLDGQAIDEQRLVEFQNGGRCVVMINKDN